MSNFWSSTFAFPNQFFTPTYYSPWFHHQGVAYAPVWAAPCYSQYQQPTHAAIHPMESNSSSSSEDEGEPQRTPGPSNPRRARIRAQQNARGPSTSQPQAQLTPRSRPANQGKKRGGRAPPGARQAPPTSPTWNSPAAGTPSNPTTTATTTLSRIRSARAGDHASKGLREAISRSPSTFTPLSPLAYKRERPSNWRPDYLPPSASWMKRRLFGLKTVLTDQPNNLSRSLILNPLLLQPNTTNPPSSPSVSYHHYYHHYYYYDLRCNPFSAYLLHLPHSNGPINHLHLVQAATVPPTHEYLYIWHHRFPWIITVRSTHSNGILVSDVLGTIYTDLMTPITTCDYYNVDMTAEDRERVEAAYKRRCNGDVGLLKRGILRVDFLGEYVGFTGLVRSWNGMWEMRTVDVTVREGEREEDSAGSLGSSDLSASLT